MTDRLFEIPPDAQPDRCKDCRGVIYWVRTPYGRVKPVDQTGVCHFDTCPTPRGAWKRAPLKHERHEQMAELAFLKRIRAQLGEWEIDFISSASSRLGNNQALSRKQRAKLHDIYCKHGGNNG